MSRPGPLFTAADLEPTAEELAKARARVAGRGWADTDLFAASALRVRMPALVLALTLPYGARSAARDLRHLAAVARACEEHFDALRDELDAQIAADDQAAPGRPSGGDC
ncbi:hypothetical protein [Frankia tisae]|uniref:hypothetical protein n=1 Tax=Frankia tisae TaxID=2950104 RepID=UPI0021BFE919|nr:hypothetical protein [Frankia tisae]